MTQLRDIREERVEAVLHKSSRELVAVLILMPTIVSSGNNKSKASSSIKTKGSFDASFWTLDSNVDTIGDYSDEAKKSLLG